MTTETGGGAFPRTVGKIGEPCCPGMTLRDYFAGQVLAGLGHNFEILFDGTRIEQYNYDHMAECAYKTADAMLWERKVDAV